MGVVIPSNRELREQLICLYVDQRHDQLRGTHLIVDIYGEKWKNHNNDQPGNLRGY
jgi:hypothetical protein